MFSIDGVYLLLMQNVFSTPSSLNLRAIPKAALQNIKKYDLKGSTVARTSEETASVLKDNNCRRTFTFPQDVYQKLCKTITSDARFLCSHGFIDYSLILGVTPSLKRFGRFSISEEVIAARESKGKNIRINSQQVKDINQAVLDDITQIQNRAREQNIPIFFTSDGEMCFCQVIDFLTVYSAKKKAERCFKSLYSKTSGLSVQEPVYYYERFRAFILEII